MWTDTSMENDAGQRQCGDSKGPSQCQSELLSPHTYTLASLGKFSLKSACYSYIKNMSMLLLH